MKQKQSAWILDLAENNDGYVEVAALKQMGVAQTALSSLVEEGVFRKVAKGLYLRRGYPEDIYYILHRTYKKAVFSLRSSAVLQGLLDDGDEPYCNLPTGYMTHGLPGATCRHVGKKEFELGLSLAVTKHGNFVPCYDKERTLIDVLRYPESFSKKEIESIFRQAYPNANQEKLNGYARAFKSEGALKLALAFLRS